MIMKLSSYARYERHMEIENFDFFFIEKLFRKVSSINGVNYTTEPIFFLEHQFNRKKLIGQHRFHRNN